ncbi:MAG: hypothetical protein P9M13_00315 [Candidatus Ancaeobacter aquaticus]|nr:hypothetical protein [Candidatus Ancaeobacter aquaticus]
MIKDKKIKEWYHKNKDCNENAIAKILDVEYAHIVIKNRDDLYVTKHGLPFIDNLMPENHISDKEWFKENSEPLSGTSAVYKVRTKQVNGKHKDLVIKWNRMGKNILGSKDAEELMTAEYNSPFEEFSLVMDLRNILYRPSNKIIIQKPLAIYVPIDEVKMWQTGRIEYKMQRKIITHKDVLLDMSRCYAVIYEWIEGIDATQAFREGILTKEHVKKLTLETEDVINTNSFSVRDRKPNHIIIRPKKDGNILRDKDGNILYGLVDFELLQRIPEQEKIIKQAKRAEYLKRQRDRFITNEKKKFHPHLSHVSVLGVDYIYGNTESTKGKLWVVGKDPYLFDYFLPERWEHTIRTKISVSSEMYHTVTKDNIHLVWKMSRVGLQPDMDPFIEDENEILKHGYNSPFEEVSIAIKLSKRGVPTIYPRAIYMTGNKTNIPQNISDISRYESHEKHLTPEGEAILNKHRGYIVIWGYWNGPDEKLVAKDGDYYEGINALSAYREGVITKDIYIILLEIAKEKLLKAGIQDLYLRGNHFLISFNESGELVKDKNGIPEIRLGNFEFLKRI